MILPNSFQNNIMDTYGGRGKEWLMNLPNILKQCSQHWHIHILPTDLGLSFNYVTTVIGKDGTQMILKVCFPEEKEFHTELETLKFYNGKYAVQILDQNLSLGAVLLEKISPATSLKTIQNDTSATKIAASLMKVLLMDVPNQHSLPDLDDWMQAIEDQKSLLASEIRSFIDQIIGRLSNYPKKNKLLHGDLHQDNILWDKKRGWLAIDPKGLIGPPAFQAARFLRNFWDVPPNIEILKQRISIISEELQEPTLLIAIYAYLDFIMGNCWILETNPNHQIDSHLEQVLRKAIERLASQKF